ncbi:anamorsin [Cocos nucifera]|uniref:Anamorsin n=1 Tax=Cocos nucifera TaxID=13894 RepID=A0A8K0INH2_COCNU|nr:anamorsin [Cocos nucifera]
MAAMKRRVLVATDDVAIPVSVVLAAVECIGVDVPAEEDVLVVTRATAIIIRGKLPIETASMDGVISLMKKPELVGEQWIEEIARVLKPDGKILIQTSLSSLQLTDDKLSSGLERKLLMAGFVEVQTVEMKALLPIEADGDQLLTIKGKKASWKIGSSFSLKKATYSSAPKIQIDGTLLTEEDLKKPQLLPGLQRSYGFLILVQLEIVKLEAKGRFERTALVF